MSNKQEIEWTLEDNTDEVLTELEKRMPEALFGVGNELYKSIYNFMTDDKIVDTGRLRGSISFSTPYQNYKNPTPNNKENDFIENANFKNTVVYGSNVEYASFVNSGTSKQRARKFLENGTARAIPNIKAVVEKVLKGGKEWQLKITT